VDDRAQTEEEIVRARIHCCGGGRHADSALKYTVHTFCFLSDPSKKQNFSLCFLYSPLLPALNASAFEVHKKFYQSFLFGKNSSPLLCKINMFLNLEEFACTKIIYDVSKLINELAPFNHFICTTSITSENIKFHLFNFIHVLGSCGNPLQKFATTAS
jgi:hypothetical protein